MAVRLSALRAGHPLLPGRFLVLISVRGWVDRRSIVWLEGLGQLKHSVTSSGIEPATLRLVAYCPNQLHYCVPPTSPPSVSRLSRKCWKPRLLTTTRAPTASYRDSSTVITYSNKLYGRFCCFITFDDLKIRNLVIVITLERNGVESFLDGIC
jgi:hypothetical protein